MLVQCPHCSKSVVVNGLGRRPLNIAVTKVCDALRLQRTGTLGRVGDGSSLGW